MTQNHGVKIQETPFYDRDQQHDRDNQIIIVSEGTYKVNNQQSDMAEFLRLHQRIGHIPFKKMNIMARQNVIPKRFEKCPAPIRVACTYSKLPRKAWRNKPPKGYQHTQKAKVPGDRGPVDQLVSPTPGLIVQLTGRLTIKRYKYATVYMDNYSRYGYVRIKKSSSAEETIEGKEIFKSHM